MPLNVQNGLACALFMMLTACNTTGTTETIKAPEAAVKSIPCVSVKEISFSGNRDTAQTVQEVREINAVFRELCP